MKDIFIRVVSFIFGVLAFAAGSAEGQSVSFATNSWLTGNGPVSVIGADVFGTGRPAIITANQADNSLTVLGNFGNGTFASNGTYKVSSPPNCVLAADVNGDGKLDLIAVAASATMVFTNYNSGLFGSNTTINAGGLSALAFDLNGDGSPDLLIGGNASVLVYTNNGKGGFGASLTLSVPGQVYGMAVADVNLDGKPDLIVANLSNGSLTVFTNAGGGLLVSNATYTVGSSPRSVIAVDLNGDGYVDLIAGNAAGYPNATLSILTNNGSGIFGSNSTLNVARGCVGMAGADFNGDGRIDLVALDGEDRPGVVSILTNSVNGLGTYFTVAAGLEPQAMAMVDFNGDGKPDLVLGNSGNTVTVLLNTTVFASPPLNVVSTGGQSVLYWNSPAPNSVLQTTTNLNNPSWMTVPVGVPIQGVVLPHALPAQYYRLISQ